MANTSVRQSWLDGKSKTPLIDEYTQKLSDFVEAISHSFFIKNVQSAGTR